MDPTVEWRMRERMENRIEIIQSVQKKTYFKNINRASGTCGTIIKDLLFISMYGEERRKSQAQKVFRELIPENFQSQQKT